jgi:prepilin-type N-terminal cleavage/methylation domain-containing protein
MKRKAFTLTELIVVIGILAFVMTLTALYLPGFRERDTVNRSADKLVMWLVSVRQQAIRDRTPVGLRLIVKDGVVTSFVSVRQPGDPSIGMFIGHWEETTSSNAVAFFQLPRDKDGVEQQFDSPRFDIKPGDYLTLAGKVHQIVSVQHQSLTLKRGTATLPGPVLPDTNPRGATQPFLDKYPVVTLDPVTMEEITTWYDDNARTNFKITKQCRFDPNEQEIDLPEGTYIDIGKSRGITPLAPDDTYEVLFSPNGTTMGGGTGTALVVIYVTRIDGKGSPLLVTVSPRTGFVATHPVASGDDPYLFTKDARSSGM